MPLTDEECLSLGFDRAAFMARARPYSYDHRQPTSLYVMQCGEHVRVGIAGDVARRAAAVQARNPLPVKVRHTREFSSRLYALMVEAEAHRSLKGHHVHGEWFSAPLPHVRRILALIYPCMRRLEQRYQAEEDARVEQMERTERGFAIHTFTDINGVDCRLQKSSLATDDAIWLGARDIGLKKFTPYAGGWQDVPLEMDPHGVNHIANTAMHLSREQVAELLPMLQRFVDTGEISPPPSSVV